MCPRRDELPVEAKAEAARFVNHVHGVSGTQQRLDPRDELLRREPPRRLGQRVIVLRRDHVELRVDIQPKLDRRRHTASGLVLRSVRRKSPGVRTRGP